MYSAFEFCTNLTSVGLPINLTNIGQNAFYQCSSLPQITIPDTVTSIGLGAFISCRALVSVTLPASLKTLYGLFDYCTGLTEVAIPSNVTSIRDSFADCQSLTTITIPASVTNIGDYSFSSCFSLTRVLFYGNAPGIDSTAFFGAPATLYHLPGTTGWPDTLNGLPTALWTLPYPLILTGGSGFGVQANGFGFTVSWATNLSVVVEASSDLFNGAWQPLQTNALAGGSFYFSDPQWTNSPKRFYRVRAQYP